MQGNAPDEEHIDEHGECAAEIKRLRAALEELTSACEVEFESEETADEPDDEPVGSGRKEDGSPDWMVITFGMIRRARAALNQPT